MRVFTLLLGAVLLSSTAGAAVIKPVATSSSSNENGAFAPLGTINGQGLTPPGVNPAEIHDFDRGFNHWRSGPTGATNASITWNFGPNQTLGGIYIWNHQDILPSGSQPGTVPTPTTVDITLFDLLFFDPIGTPLLVLDDLSILPNVRTAQFVGFGQLINNVASVRLEVEATEGNLLQAGLAEVAFDDSRSEVVPLPASVLFLLGGLGALAGLRRRRS